MVFGVSFTLGSCAFAGFYCTLGSFAFDILFIDGILSNIFNESEIMRNALFTSSPDYNAGDAVEGGFFMMEKNQFLLVSGGQLR